jgi:hypothetical protein
MLNGGLPGYVGSRASSGTVTSMSLMTDAGTGMIAQRRRLGRNHQKTFDLRDAGAYDGLFAHDFRMGE